MESLIKQPAYLLEGDTMLDTAGRGVHTVELHITHPLAQNPRSQRALQLTATAGELHNLANFILATVPYEADRQ